MSKPTQVFLNIKPVARRQGPRDAHVYRAEWIARGTGCVMYTSKVCEASTDEDARAAAAGLARAWLAKQNARPSRIDNILASEAWTGPRYADTTKY